MTSTLIVTSTIFVSTVPDYAVGWGCLSLINAGLAQSKNHSGLAWWLISLLLGPVATLIIVAVLNKDDRPTIKGGDEYF